VREVVYTDDPIINAVVSEVRPVVLDSFTPDSCVATVRITIDTLAYFGIRAKPLPVGVVILNHEAHTLLTEHDMSMEQVRQATLPYSIDDAGGPWLMGVGIGDEDAAGHVVTWLPDHEVLLELSLDQANRPHKNLVFEPVAARVNSPDFITTPEAWQPYIVDFPDGQGSIHYQHAKDARFRKSPNWRGISDGKREAFRHVTAEAIRRVRELQG
jgi:hypothetical protein